MLTIKNPEALLVVGEVAKNIPVIAEKILDTLSSAAQIKMGMEAPKATGLLSTDIDVGQSRLRRVIEPVAQNLSSHWSSAQGKKYAINIEKGWGPTYPNVPNIDNIALWYGTGEGTQGKQLAYAIAVGIAKKRHAPDPFVERTADYLITILPRLAKEFAENIAIGVRTMSRGL